jgi:hypothetical protein
MKKLLSILIVAASLNIAHAQSNLNLSSDAQEMLKFLHEPENKNDSLNSPQVQNDNELVMSIMKFIEDKNIKEKNKKIEFINSLSVSNEIKQQAISYVNQNLTYSDHEKVSYGLYLLKKCKKTKDVSMNSPSASQTCYGDYKPNGKGMCAPERSNICCTN